MCRCGCVPYIYIYTHIYTQTHTFLYFEFNRYELKIRFYLPVSEVAADYSSIYNLTSYIVELIV